MIYTIRKSSNLLPVIAGIALMTITACGSAAVSDFSKATQDAAIATAVASATAEATAAAEAIAATATQTAADTARAAQNTAVATARAEEKRIAQTAQGIAVAAARCTDPICDNVVKADDLPSYPTTVTSNSSAFLTIEGTQIFIADLERSNSNALAASDINGLTRADICEARGGNEATCASTKNTNTMGDGVQYFQGRLGDSGNPRTFAGILPTTNLGAPLTAQPTTAKWPGSYSDRGRTAASLDFNIDFINRRITATTGDTLEFFSLSFNLGFSDSGVISGLVLEHNGGVNTAIVSSRTATGLIGTEGLVGVFIDAGDSQTGLRYVGGFVATNPSP